MVLLFHRLMRIAGYNIGIQQGGILQGAFSETPANRVDSLIQALAPFVMIANVTEEIGLLDGSPGGQAW